MIVPIYKFINKQVKVIRTILTLSLKSFLSSLVKQKYEMRRFWMTLKLGRAREAGKA